MTESQQSGSVMDLQQVRTGDMGQVDLSVILRCVAWVDCVSLSRRRHIAGPVTKHSSRASAAAAAACTSLHVS